MSPCRCTGKALQRFAKPNHLVLGTSQDDRVLVFFVEANERRVGRGGVRRRKSQALGNVGRRE